MDSQQAHAVGSLNKGYEYLNILLGGEEYGIDILKVQEIRGYDQVTAIANAPPHLKGVINLRGVIVPIVDLRIKFRLDRVSYDEFTVVIILNMGSRTVGIVVDGVSDVLALRPEQVSPPPSFSTGLDLDYITGLGSLDGRTLLLVDIERLMLGSDMGVFDALSTQTVN